MLLDNFKGVFSLIYIGNKCLKDADTKIIVFTPSFALRGNPQQIRQ